MKPYYESDGIIVYHARWEDVVAAGLVPIDSVAFIHGDPTYGQGLTFGPRKKTTNTVGKGTARVPRPDWSPIAYADEPFDPAPILALNRPTALWGANHYSEKLPVSPSWWVWDKREDTPPDTCGDGEMAWTNLGGPMRIFNHLWRGTCRASECATAHLYPSQKPVALSAWAFQQAKVKRGDLIFVPFMGSGPDLTAALAIGARVIACDISEEACRIAVSARLRAAPQAQRIDVGPLFERTL